MPPLLEIKGLTKRYGSLIAVAGVDLTIARGSCVGLLGPNGAGKTTTVEMIENVIKPTAGEILYKGHLRAQSFLEEVGIMFQETALLSFLTVRETLTTFQRLYQSPLDLETVMALCSLGNIGDQYNNKISGGQKQRLLLALALINQPQLLFLDEPSTGLDPHARLSLWQVIEKIKAQQKTIVLTTHYMEEAQQLCDRIAIMDHGRIVAEGSPESLIQQYCRGVTVRFPKTGQPRPENGGCGILRETEGHFEIETDDANQCLAQLLGQGIDLSRMSIRVPNLEDVFLNITGRQLRD